MGLLGEVINEFESPAILLGNGINQISKALPNWEDLLKSVGGVQIKSDGLTNTEIYDFIELRNRNIDVKERIIEELAIINGSHKIVYKSFLKTVAEKKCPVLTTNFDLILKNVGNLEFYRTRKTGFSRYYPWDTYLSNSNLTYPMESFGIWHIHGLVHYKDSIRLGLSDYMGSVEKARKLIHQGEAGIFRGKNQSKWKGKDTWLHIWFNKPLIIVGLGLKPDEVFIRWLLIERKKYFRKFPQREKKTYYLSTGKSDRLDNFLFNLNIEHIGTSKYEDLYK